MQILSSEKPAAEIEADWLAVGVHEGNDSPPGSIEGTGAGALVARLLASRDLPTGTGDTLPLHEPSGLAAGGLLVYGLGARDRFGPGAAYSAGCAVGKRLAARPRGRVAVVPPGPTAGSSGGAADLAAAFVEGVIVGTRGPGLRKSEPSRHTFGELIVTTPDPGLSGGALASLEKLVRRAAIVGEAVNLARDLVNTPPSEKPPARLATQAREIAEAAGAQAEVWDLERIRRERFGGLLAVAAGSSQPPAFVHLRYRGAGGQKAAYALVGKGVTFDSGGLSLKPSASMEDMKADMTGAAIVLATVQAVARLGLPVDLDAYLILTENMTGGSAMKLGDVLTMRNGTTIEVLNTDAEGRLILADALSYAAEQKPARILDLATLTGACLVALGNRIAGLFSSDDAFAGDLLKACGRTGERAWRMPLDDDFQEQLKSHVADFKNTGTKWGGAITAAKLLQHFAGSTPWVHLDVAGPGWADSDAPVRDVGGTGCFVRTLVALLEADAKAR